VHQLQTADDEQHGIAAGSLVATSEGLIAIESITHHHFVWSYNVTSAQPQLAVPTDAFW
jgi:hypothetical protein